MLEFYVYDAMMTYVQIVTAKCELDAIRIAKQKGIAAPAVARRYTK